MLGEIISLLVLFIMLVVVICAIWGLICNDRTFKERRKLYPDTDDPDFWEKSTAIARVSYDDHMKELFFFRDPKKLYDPIVFGK